MRLLASLGLMLSFVQLSQAQIQPVRDKVAGEILAHRVKKVRPAGQPVADHLTELRMRGLNPDQLHAEGCALYCDRPLTEAEIATLAVKGIRVNAEMWVPPVPGKHPHGFYLASVDYASLDAVRADPRIQRLETTEMASYPLNDLGETMINADDVHNGIGFPARTGAGVKIAVADSGIDLTHADFPTPIEAYDVTDGNSLATWSTNVANTVSPHGTHVAATALGRGALSGGRYRGSAPGASLLFYKIGNDTNASASYEDMIEAINRALAAGADIFTMSYGGVSTYLDGSEAVDQAVDAAVAAGMTVFISAGNAADDAVHDSVSVAPATTSASFGFSITNPEAAAAYTTQQWLRLIWRDGNPGDANINLVCTNLGAGETLSQISSGSSTRGTDGKVYTLTPNIAGGGSKTYTFAFQNAAVSGQTPLVHCFQITGGVDGAGTFTSPDPSFTLGHPAAADGAIAVGAWTQRKSWTDYEGLTWQFSSFTVGTLAPFSSLGPRIDGAMKPDIVAPGAATVSARDRVGNLAAESYYMIDDDGQNLNGSGPANYYIMSGTSMACPMAAGVAALILESNPSLTPAQVAQTLRSTASHAATPNASVGHGLIDALAAVQQVGVLPLPPVITSATQVTGVVNAAFSYQITASNSPTSFNATGLPSGLSVHASTGLISGTTAAVGTFNVNLSATNGNGTGTATLVLNMSADTPVITSATAITVVSGAPFSYQITATKSPTSYGATGLPPGLAINPATGLISGNPLATGTAQVGISATNANGTGTATLAISFLPANLLFDSFLGSSVTFTSGTPRTYMGMPLTLGNAGGAANIQIGGGTAYVVATSAASYTNVRLNITFWANASGATTGTTPAFSNSLGTFSIDFGAINATANTYYTCNFTLGTPVTMPAQAAGVTLHWQGNTGSGLVSTNNLTTLMRHNAPMAVGGLSIGTPGTHGFYQNASNETNNNFLGSSFRVFNGLNSQGVALRLTGPADNAAPSLSSVAIASNNSNSARAKVGDIVAVTFTANEAVLEPQATIAGRVAAVSYLGGNQWRASITMLGSDPEGTVPFSLTATDLLGNVGSPVTSVTNSSQVIFDKTIPTVVVSPTGTRTNGSPITFSLSFSESVTGLTAAGITVTNGSKGTLSGSGSSYTLPVTPSGQGAVTCRVDASAALDLSSNGSTVSNTASVTFDSAAPGFTSIGIASSNANPAMAKVGDSVTVTFTTNEAVETPAVSIAGRAATVSLISENQWHGSTIMTLADGEGAVPFSITLTDLTGNVSAAGTATTNASAVTFDKTAPTVTVTPSGTLANAAPIVFTLAFSEAVSGLTSSGIAVTNGVKGTLSGSGSTYTLQVAPSAQGAVTCQVNAAAAVDTASNGNAASNVASVTFDSIAPTLSAVSIASNNADGTRAKVGDMVTVTFTASEPVQTPVVTVAGRTASVTHLTGNQWRGSVGMTGADAEGTLSFSVTVTDSAGNAAALVNSTTDSTAVLFDKTSPSVAATSTESLTKQSPITFTLNFSEPVTGLSTDDIVVTNGVKSALSGSGASYTLPVTPTGQGTVTCQVTAGAALDAASNASAASNVASVVFDSVAPTLSAVTLASNNANASRAKVGNVLTVAFTSSEALDPPTVTIAGQTATVINTTGNQWTASVLASTDTPEGSAALSITFRDLAGNDGAAVSATTDASSVMVDRTLPALGPVWINSSNSTAGYAKAGDTITLNFNATEAIQAPVVFLTGQAATVSHFSGNQWMAMHTLTADAPQGTAALSVVFSDHAGNEGITVTTTTDGSSVIVDNKVPEFASHPQAATVDPGAAVSFSVTVDSLSPVTYQWRRNSSPIDGATARIYNISSAAQSHEGSYDCVVKNIVGTVTSDPAVLAVNDPEIVVEQPAGAPLVDAVGNITLGTVRLGGASAPHIFVIRNVGTAPLHLGALTKSGGHINDFTVDTTGMAASLDPGESTTFAVTFSPQAISTRSTTLRIPSDDADENPFDIPLTANGRLPVPGTLSIGLPAGSILLVNEEAGSVSIPIVRTGGADGVVGFSISATGGTTTGLATVLSDFTQPLSPQSLGDEATTLEVPVSIVLSAASEPHENFTVNISAPTGGASLGDVKSVTVRIIDSADGVAPAMPAVSYPAAAAPLSLPGSSSITVTGTATDDKGISAVRIKLNEGPPTEATLAAPGMPTTGFSLSMTPVGGLNSLSVQSFDARGNPSPVLIRNFVVLRQLSVQVDSSMGSVSAGYAGLTYREPGKSFTISATAKPPTSSPVYDGTIFKRWVVSGQDVAKGNVPLTLQRLGIASSMLEKGSLPFVFREGLILTAEFVPNAFAAVSGSYNGLITASSHQPVRPGSVSGTARSNSTEGLFNATVQNTGAFSGKLYVDGLVLNVAGSFDHEGNARFGSARLLSQTVARTAKPSLTVALQINSEENRVNVATDDKISGTVIATEFQRSIVSGVSVVDSDRAFYNGTSRSVPPAYLSTAGANGSFTAVFPAKPPYDAGDPQDSQSEGLTAKDYPQGVGVGSVAITKAGVVTLSAALADGTAVAASSTLSEIGSGRPNRFALYAPLYTGRGFLGGFVQMDSEASTSDMAASNLAWLRPFQGSSQYYPYGWPEIIKVDFMAAKYAAAAGHSVLRASDGTALQTADSDGNARLAFRHGALAEDLLKSLNLSSADFMTKVPDNDPTFTLTINRVTGAVTGSFSHTDDTAPIFNAVIYQKGSQSGGYGYFLTKQPAVIDYTGESGSVHLTGQP